MKQRREQIIFSPFTKKSGKERKQRESDEGWETRLDPFSSLNHVVKLIVYEVQIIVVQNREKPRLYLMMNSPLIQGLDVKDGWSDDETLQKCNIFYPATVSGTCCSPWAFWETRRVRFYNTVNFTVNVTVTWTRSRCVCVLLTLGSLNSTLSETKDRGRGDQVQTWMWSADLKVSPTHEAPEGLDHG